MTERLSPEGHHCWHSLGNVAADRSGGSDTFRCCHCNTTRVIFFTYEEQPIEGHGSFIKQRIPSFRFPDDECLGTTENPEAKLLLL